MAFRFRIFYAVVHARLVSMGNRDAYADTRAPAFTNALRRGALERCRLRRCRVISVRPDIGMTKAR